MTSKRARSTMAATDHRLGRLPDAVVRHALQFLTFWEERALYATCRRQPRLLVLGCYPVEHAVLDGRLLARAMESDDNRRAMVATLSPSMRFTRRVTLLDAAIYLSRLRRELIALFPVARDWTIEATGATTVTHTLIDELLDSTKTTATTTRPDVHDDDGGGTSTATRQLEHVRLRIDATAHVAREACERIRAAIKDESLMPLAQLRTWDVPSVMLCTDDVSVRPPPPPTTSSSALAPSRLETLVADGMAWPAPQACWFLPHTSLTCLDVRNARSAMSPSVVTALVDAHGARLRRLQLPTIWYGNSTGGSIHNYMTRGDVDGKTANNWLRDLGARCSSLTELGVRMRLPEWTLSECEWWEETCKSLSRLEVLRLHSVRGSECAFLGSLTRHCRRLRRLDYARDDSLMQKCVDNRCLHAAAATLEYLPHIARLPIADLVTHQMPRLLFVDCRFVPGGRWQPRAPMCARLRCLRLNEDTPLTDSFLQLLAQHSRDLRAFVVDHERPWLHDPDAQPDDEPLSSCTDIGLAALAAECRDLRIIDWYLRHSTVHMSASNGVVPLLRGCRRLRRLTIHAPSASFTGDLQAACATVHERCIDVRLVTHDHRGRERTTFWYGDREGDAVHRIDLLALLD